MTDFACKVKLVVQNIPTGKVMTYANVAKKAGRPKAARAVANIMAHNYDLKIPCHRVVRSDGRVGGYNRGGEATKKRLLAAEGVVLCKDKVSL